MSSIEHKAKVVIAEQLGVSVGRIVYGVRFAEDLGADSMDTVDLVMAIEDEFEVDISDEDAEKIKTYDDLVNYLKSHAIVSA